MNTLVIFLIGIYQQYFSHHKGYRCAYGAVHGTHGCSEAIKLIIENKGLVAGFADIRNQFVQCSAAYQTLLNNNELNKKRKNKDSWIPDICAESCQCIPVRSCSGKNSADCDLPCDCNPF